MSARSILDISLESMGLVIDLFRNVRSAREAEDLYAELRKLQVSPPRRANVDGIAEAVLASARHSDGTPSSD